MSWKVKLSEAAQIDFTGIIDWTIERFGDQQASAYAAVLTTALNELDDGPEQLGVRSRDDIGIGIFTLHVARHGRKGRHFVMFRVDRGSHTIEVLRLLHDAMDLPRHVPLE